MLSLFDHLVGANEQHRGHFDAKRPRGFEVDRHVEFGRLYYRKISRALALENLAA